MIVKVISVLPVLSVLPVCLSSLFCLYDLSHAFLEETSAIDVWRYNIQPQK